MVALGNYAHFDTRYLQPKLHANVSFLKSETAPSNACNFSCRYRMSLYEVSNKHFTFKMSHSKMIGSFPSVRILAVHTVDCVIKTIPFKTIKGTNHVIFTVIMSLKRTVICYHGYLPVAFPFQPMLTLITRELVFLSKVCLLYQISNNINVYFTN